LPGETVGVRVLRRSRTKLETMAVTLVAANPDRVTPDCPMAFRCGACALQHLAPAAQRDSKRGRLARLFADAGLAEPERWLPDITGPTRGYRRKARLGVKVVPGKGGVLVGFRERASPLVADLGACRVLAPVIGERLMALRAMVAELSCARAVPQLEIAVGDDAAAVVLRHLEPLTDDDLLHLRGVAAEQGWQIYLQSGGPQTVVRLGAADAQAGAVTIQGPEADSAAGPDSSPDPEAGVAVEQAANAIVDRLHYELPEFGLRMAFHPLDFTQVNAEINRVMIHCALELLAPAAADRVLDLFCGLGNFTLPLACRCAEVFGVEGSEALVARGRENADANGVTNVHFSTADLYADDFDPASLPAAELMLLDPPRSGAELLCAGIGALSPRRIVYVSCNPETLARDAVLLVAAGYRMSAAGIIDMFPHTAHVESMAVFDRKEVT